MSSIDERVVQMRFNNSQFENGIKQTTDSLENLKKGLDLKDAANSLNDLDAVGKRFSLAGIASGVDTLVSRFSALGIIGITALANITNSAVNAGKALVASLTIDPIKQGLAEYETNLNAIQTILANTQSKGSTLTDVNAALQELNTYSDKTIYNFSEMARNIGTFTAAGVDLNTSVSAIKGIANLAALSGSNADQASTAMYQLSQALATGTVKLMDWNSVVNAGMGGQVFQDAIKDTARVHGVAVDKIIKDEGSFRDSLQKGWLTADILNETLARFTGDLNADQLRSMGYTEEQIQASIKLGQTAADAATKVKTASQLIGTLQEAVGSGWTQSWQLVFGDFEEARTLWTGVNNVLGKMIGDSSNARNQILGDWKALGGRTALIDAVKFAWEDLMTVLEPIQDAFKHIFPPVTGKNLADLTKNLRDFFQSIKLGGADTNNLRRTFQGVFAIFDIGWQVIQKVARMLGNLLGFANKGSGSFLEFTAKIGDWLTKLDEAIKKGDKLNGFFTGLEKVLKIPIAILQFLGNAVKKFFDNLGNNQPLKAFGDAVGSAFETVKQRFDFLRTFADWVTGAFKAMLGFFQKVGQVFRPIAQAIDGFLASLGASIANAVKTSDFSGVFQLINTGLFGALVLAVRKFFKDGAKLNIDFGGGIVETLKGTFGALTDTLGAMQSQIKSKIIMNIAIAVGILVASLVALALVDPAKLAVGLVGITAVLGELFGGLALLTKIIGMDAFGPAKILAITAAMDLIGAALLTISGAVAIMGHLSWEELAKGLVGLAGAMAVMVGAVTLLSLLPAPALLAASVAIVAVSGALVIASVGLTILAGAMKIMGTLSWEDIGKGLTIFSAGLLILAVSLTAMALTGPGAAGLILAAAGLAALAPVLKLLAGITWSELGMGMAVIGASLGVLAIGLTAMIASGPGALALTVAAAALLILAWAFKIFSTFSWEDFGKSMAFLGTSLAIIAVAGVALLPAIPGLIGLGVAAVLIGAGALAAGIGLLAFSAGLAALAITGAIGTAAMVAMVSALIGLIPTLAASLGQGVIAFANVISTGGPAFITAGVTLMMSLLTAIQTVSPQINATFGQLLLDCLNTIAANIQAYTDAGMRILLGFLQGIEDHLSEVIDKGGDIIVKFIQGVQENSNKVADAAADAIVKFVKGLADTIDSKTDEMRDAGGDLAWAIINGMTGGLADGIGDVVAGAAKLATSAWNAAMGALDAHSPSRKFIKLGGWTAEGLVIGMDNGNSMVANSASNMGNSAIEAMKTAMAEVANVVSTDVNSTPTIRPVLDMTSFKKDASQIGSYFQSPSLSLDNSYNQAASVAVQERENQAYLSADDQLATDANGNIVFNQYNNSPKALSAAELYRQTKNQISLAKDVLAIS